MSGVTVFDMAGSLFLPRPMLPLFALDSSACSASIADQSVLREEISQYINPVCCRGCLVKLEYRLVEHD